MTAAAPVDVQVNPNDSTQRYTLWGNGRIDAAGGAPPITSGPKWFDRWDQPVAVALHITDWTTGAGYLLDFQGGVQPLNDAPALGSGSAPQDCTALGLPYLTTHTRVYVDWSWDPGGSGRAIVLDIYGRVYALNGANLPPSPGPLWAIPAAKKIKALWAAGQPSKALVLDLYGGIHPYYTGTGKPTGYPYFSGVDAARDFVITDWTANPPQGYSLDLYGTVFGFSGLDRPHGYPYKGGADVARVLAVLSASNPTTLLEVWAGGQQFEWTASNPPTVTAGGIDGDSPAATVTDSTRPVQAWAYSDPNKDAQAAWEVMDFTQAFANAHNMTDPHAWDVSAVVSVSGTDSAQRGVVADYDFPNGSYRMFVRVQDTSGLWSAWSTHDWTQNVPAPAAPTGLTAVADPGTFTVALSVHCATGGSADAVAFGYSDDGGATWGLVRGAEAVPLAATTTAVDRDVPLNVWRQYGAVAYNDSPRVVSARSNIATATVAAVAYVLTSTADPALGGEARVQEPVEWTRTAAAGVFEGVGAEFPIVVSDGTPKSRRTTLHLLSLDADTLATIQDLAESNSTLVLRDPYGSVMYCRLVGDWLQSLMEGAGERSLHTADLPLVEVAAPTPLSTSTAPAVGS